MVLFFVLFIVLAAALPHAMAALMPAAGLTQMAQAIKGKKFYPNRAVWAFIIGLSALMLLSHLWTLTPDISLEKTLKTLGLFLGALLLFVAPMRFHMTHTALIAMLVLWVLCCAVILIDNQTAWGVQKTVTSWPFFDRIQYRTALFNKANLLLALTFIPLSIILIKKKKIKSFLLSLIIVTAAIFSGYSESAKLSLVSYPVIFTLTMIIPRLSIALTTGSYAIFAVIAPWVMPNIYLQYADKLSQILTVGSPGARLEIWAAVSEKIQASPILGYGVNATRSFEGLITQQAYFNNSEVLHPHNAALQYWVDLGFLGVVFHLNLIGFIAYSIAQMNDKFLKAASHCLLVAVLICISTTFGIWQGWWIASLIMLAWFMITLVKTKDWIAS